MPLLVLDFETYYDKTYTLKKLTTEEYIRNPQFEALTFCGYWPETDTDFMCLGRDEIEEAIAGIDWARTTVLSHHMQFDGLILSHHYGALPQSLWCTLSMARALGTGIRGDRLSLDALTTHFGLERKNVNYGAFMGRRLHELTEQELITLGHQCLNDCHITYDLFLHMLKVCEFPQQELTIIDTTVKMFTAPHLIGNAAHFEALSLKELERKEKLLRDLNIERSQLMSANEFVQLLNDNDITVAYKEGKKGPIPCIAKTDQFMRDLLEHEDEHIRALAEARLDVKSTIVETRAARMAAISSRGPLPIYLNYCGAGTTRWSGGDKQNAQNFNRKGSLREGITAPDGHKLIIVDERQIEARTLVTVAGQDDIRDMFARGDDVYRAQAAITYGKRPEDIDADERGTGKQLILSCGYGAGAYTVQRTAKAGMYGPPKEIDLGTADAWKTSYREAHPEVVRLWYWAGDVLRWLLSDMRDELPFPDDKCPPVWPVRGERKLLMPSGLCLDYSSLSWTPLEPWEEETKNMHNFFWQKNENKTPKDFEEKHKIYYKDIILKRRGEHRRIYGAMLVQNIMEALARTVISDGIIDLRKEKLFDAVHVVLMAHDELVLCCPDNLVEATVPKITKALTTSPVWLPSLPLDVEVKVSERYGK